MLFRSLSREDWWSVFSFSKLREQWGALEELRLKTESCEAAPCSKYLLGIQLCARSMLGTGDTEKSE